MKVNSDYHTGVSFKSGLTKPIMDSVAAINVAEAQSAFAQKYGVKAHFAESQFYSFAFSKVAEMFEDMSKRYGLPFEIKPPKIWVYNKEQLINKQMPDNFCLHADLPVFNPKEAFEARSIFMRKRDDIQKINKEHDWAFEQHQRSSSHFLGDTIHEWCHNLHMNSVFKTENFKKLMLHKNRLQSWSVYDEIRNFDKGQKKQIRRALGSFAADSNSRSEVAAEGLTRLITESLDPDTLLVTNNPMDNFKKLPAEVRKIINEDMNL